VDNNAAVTWAMHGTGTETVGLGANAVTGGGGSSSISLTSDTAGAILQLEQDSNYIGSWSIGSNATAQVDRESSFGATGNAVAIAGGTLQTVADVTTSRAYNITGTSALDVASGTTFTMAAGIGTGSGTTTKSNGGTLVLGAASTRSGTIAITGGEVHVQNATGLGSTSSVTIGGGTALEIDNVSVGNPISMAHTSTLRGSGASASATGPVAVDSNAAVNFATNVAGDNFVIGTMTGGGGTATLNFNGPGTIVLEGGSANSAVGLVQVNSGTLRLFKFQTNGAVAAGSNVSIGGTGSGTLVLDNPEQIWDSANVNVFSGQFQLNGQTETIGTVTMLSLIHI
jgi:fibronectin-binding autotransporter adhesin